MERDDLGGQIDPDADDPRGSRLGEPEIDGICCAARLLDLSLRKARERGRGKAVDRAIVDHCPASVHHMSCCVAWWRLFRCLVGKGRVVRMVSPHHPRSHPRLHDRDFSLPYWCRTRFDTNRGGAGLSRRAPGLRSVLPRFGSVIAESRVFGDICGGGSGGHVQLAVEPTEGTFHGIGAHEQFVGDLGDGFPCRELRQDLALAFRQ